MKALRLIPFLLLALTVSATERVTVTLTVTNAAQIGDTFTINASTRTFATNNSTTTIQTNATIGGTATNLYTHLLLNPPSGPTFISQTGTNVIAIAGSVGQAMTASLLTNWGTIAYSTQTVSLAMGVRVPISSEPTATNRQYIAGELVKGIEAFSAEAFSGATFALTNFLNKTNSGQAITGANTYTGANVFSNSGQSFVGGTISNAVVVGGNITNNGANVFRGTNLIGTLTASNMVNSKLTQPVIAGAGAGFVLTNTAGAGFSVALYANSTNLVIADPYGGSDSIAIGPEFGILPVSASGLSLGGSGGSWKTVWIAGGAGILENNSTIFTNRSWTNLNAVNATNLVGTLARSFVTNSTGVNLTNVTALSGDPTLGATINSVSGSLRYRTSGSNEGSGANNYLHNRASEVVGSGTDYSLTTSYALVDFSGTDPDINTLPTAGTYFITAIIAVNVGANSGDDFSFKLYDASAAADIANSEIQFDGTGHSGVLTVNIHSVATFTGANRIQLYGKNGTANRGSVTSTLTKLVYVRLY